MSEITYIVSRGFISVVRCTLAEWMGGECGCENGSVDTGGSTPWGEPISQRCPECHGSSRVAGIGPRLAQEWPIERVEVVDITDFGFDSDGLWLAANLPIAITERIPNHGIFPADDGRSFADWLSDALIAWARSQPIEEGRS